MPCDPQKKVTNYGSLRLHGNALFRPCYCSGQRFKCLNPLACFLRWKWVNALSGTLMSATTAAYAEARWAELERQSDLDWDLDAITDRREAVAFLQRFENRLCIYSSYVEKLYSNYSFVVPEAQEGSITILPDEQAWHDTFNDIPADAVEPTGIHIL